MSSNVPLRLAPGHRNIGRELAETWQARDLLFTFADRDIRLRYRQTVLGVLSDRFGRKVVLAPSMVALGVLVALLAIVPAGLALGIVIAAIGLFFYTLANISTAAMFDVAEGPPSPESSSGTSNCTAIHSKSAAPTSFR